MVPALAVVAGLSLVAGGCNFSKTGKVAPNAPDVVTVLPTVGGSTTSVTLDAATVSSLTSLGVSLRPTGSARLNGSVVEFPITSGYAEVHSRHDVKPGWIDGSLDHAGSGLDVVGAGTTVHLTDFVVDPGNSVLYATVDGMVGVPLLTLDGAKVTEAVNDAGQVVLNGTVAKLTATAAGALDKAFSTTAITAGLPLGTVMVVLSGVPVTYDQTKSHVVNQGPSPNSTVPDHVTAISRLDGTSTTLTLNPAVASTLSSAGLAISPTGSATSPAAGQVSFPITGGFVAIHSNKAFLPGYVVGTILHQGSGITIGPASAGGSAPTVSLSNFIVDPGDSVLTGSVDGKIGVPLFFLNGSKLTVTPTANGAILNGTVAQLTPVAAKALDAAFSTSAFTAGLALGMVHLVASGGPAVTGP